MPDNTANGRDTSWIWIALLALLVYSQYQGGCQNVIGGQPPFAADKLTVLVKHKAGDIGSVPSWVNGQDESSLRGWVEKHGGDFRLLDENSAAADLGTKWQAALKVPHSSTPWIVAADQRTGFSNALPATRENALAQVAPMAAK